MRKQSTLIYGFALLVGDFLALLSAFVIAYLVRVKIDVRPLIVQIPGRTYVSVFAALIPFWLIIFSGLGLYKKEVWSNWWREIWLLFIGSFIGILFIIGYDFISDEPVFPARLVALYSLFLGFGLLVLERTLMRVLRKVGLRFGIGTTRVMVIGDSQLTMELCRALIEHPTSGYHLSAIVASKKHIPINFEGKIYHSLNQAMKALDTLDIESVIQTQLSPRKADNERILAETARRHLEYRFVPQQSSALTAHSELELFAGFPMLALHQTKLIGWGRVIKRSFDIIIGGTLLVLLSPILLLIALGILIFDRGPIFYRDPRLTRYGQEIRVWKFRTMRVAYSGKDPIAVFNDMGRPDLAKQYLDNRAKVIDDPRVSSIGKGLRQLSLDELPQLFNVLSGSMSLVGPRAIPKAELEYFKDKGPLVLNVKTGITGLAQVSGRSDISIDERLRLDLYYVQNWSIWMDIKILLLTVWVVISRVGAQ